MDPRFLSLNILYFWTCSLYTVIAPFFPTVAKEKGMNDQEIGILFR